jgi:hypothetical protein
VEHSGEYSQRAEKGDRRVGWYLRIGPLSLTHSRLIAPTGKTRHSNYLLQWHHVKSEGGRRRRWLLLLPVMAIGAPVSLWAARTPPTAVAQLVVPLPPASQAVPMIRQQPIPQRKISTLPRTEVKQTPALTEAGAVGFEDVPAVGRALRVALRLGEVQDWSAEDGREGLVVVAPKAEALDGRTCRETTILIRNGGFEGQTRTGRFCIDAANRITMSSVSAPAQE